MQTNLPSKKQKELLSFIDSFVENNGYSPSYREIMSALDYKSVSTVAIHVDNLIAKGYLLKQDNAARTLEVLTPEFVSSKGDSREIEASAHEIWLLDVIKDKLNTLEQFKLNDTSSGLLSKQIDDTRLLIDALKILDMHEAYTSMKNVLDAYVKQLDQTTL